MHDSCLILDGMSIGDEVCIYSTAGHIIKKLNATAERLSITLDDGIYILRINDLCAKVINIH